MDERAAVAALTRRLQSIGDPTEIPLAFVEQVQIATQSAAVELHRPGQTGVWTQIGTRPSDDASPSPNPYELTARHLGQPIAVLVVLPRPAESALTDADRRMVDALTANASPALHRARLAPAFQELTDRERQVLAGIVRGLPNSAIAQRLGVSTKTVANYVSIVLTKLRVPDRAHAAELVRRRWAELGD